MPRTVFVVVALVACCLFTRQAAAHTVGLSNGEYAADGTTLRAKLIFARVEVAAALPELDANGDGHVTAIEVAAARQRLGAELSGGIRVSAGGEPCAATLRDAALTEQDGLVIEGTFACPPSRIATRVAPSGIAAAPTPMRVELPLLGRLARGHRHVARAIGAATRDEVVSGERASFSIEPEPEPEASAEPPPEVSRPRPAGGVEFFRMGIEHILTGWDHLAFLLGLVLLRSRVRAFVGVVTAFTAAHSLTLALAMFGVLAPSPRIVEPAIALSVAYVGVENLFAKDGSKRWRLTFPFGLVHGFGFAGALREIALPRDAVPGALVAFNLGVEAGQLAVMAIVLPVLAALREREPWFDPRGVRVVSGALAVAGGIWFVSRLVG